MISATSITRYPLVSHSLIKLFTKLNLVGFTNYFFSVFEVTKRQAISEYATID